MESRYELKETDFKNCTCYHFDDIIKDVDIYLRDILLDQKLYQNISVYDILYKTSTESKPLCIRFDKIDGFIRLCGDEVRHLVSFDYEMFDKICHEIKYLISKKCGILQIVLIIILEKSGFIHIILYLMKKY